MFYLHLTSLYSLAGARTLADVIKTSSNDVTTPFASQDTRENLQNTSKTIENKDEAHLQVLGKETASKDEKLPHGAQANNSSNSSNENGANTSTQNDVIDVTSSMTFTSDSSPEMTHRFPPKSVENGENNQNGGRILTIKSTSHAVLIMLLSIVVLVTILFTLFGLFTKAEAHTKERTSYRNGLLCDNREGQFPMQATSLFYDQGEL